MRQLTPSRRTHLLHRYTPWCLVLSSVLLCVWAAVELTPGELPSHMRGVVVVLVFVAGVASWTPMVDVTLSRHDPRHCQWCLVEVRPWDARMQRLAHRADCLAFHGLLMVGGIALTVAAFALFAFEAGTGLGSIALAVVMLGTAASCYLHGHHNRTRYRCPHCPGRIPPAVPQGEYP